jgi:hypothetical protein
VAESKFQGQYAQFLDDRITVELVGEKGQDGRSLDQVWSVVQSIAVNRSINGITPEKAEQLTSKVFELYPNYVKDLEKKLIKAHLSGLEIVEVGE